MPRREQRTKVEAIVKAAVDDVMALRKDPAARREKRCWRSSKPIPSTGPRAGSGQGGAIWCKPKPPRSGSCRPVADAAEVLKPEQRRQLADEWHRWHMLP